MTLLRDFWEGLMHLAFPEICLGCMSHESRRNDFLCIECLYNLPYTHDFNRLQNAFERHFTGRVKLKNGAALFVYTEIVESLIHQFKYEGMTKIGKRFGTEMGQRIKSSDTFKNLNVIIPIPLHTTKLKQRGFNQSQILAEAIGKVLSLPVDRRAIQRSRRTKTQTKKSRDNRIENLRSAFEVNPLAEIAGKNVLIVDDVLTTGATLESAALVLHDAGVQDISMITLAMGQS